MVERVLLRRMGALGDVINTTPVMARLRRELGPRARIDLHTEFPTPYIGPGWKNSDVDDVVLRPTLKYDRVIDLDMAHEKNRRVHTLDAYFQAAFGDLAGDRRIVFPVGTAPIVDGVDDWTKIIVIHPNTSWPSRTVPKKVWQRICDEMVKLGYKIMVMGTGIDQVVAGPGIIDTRSKMNLHQQAAAMSAAQAIICGESGPYILTGAVDTPTVVFLSISDPRLSLPYRYGELGWNYYSVVADIECQGCNKEQGAVTRVDCNRGDLACIPTLTWERAVEATLRGIKEDKRDQDKRMALIK